MSNFFNLFPRTKYTLSDSKYPNYKLVTNILFRTAIVRDILNNSSSYIEYVVKEQDTPEILASKVYGNPEAHWIILYANEMVDAQYDWPLNSRDFYKYIANKYRSQAEVARGRTLQDYEVVSWSQDRTTDSAVHHYEKVIRRVNQTLNTTVETRFWINLGKETSNEPGPARMDTYINLPDEQGVTPINISMSGQTIIETEFRDFKTYYDYELDLNEKKRNIKIIKSQYYPIIIQEFNNLTNNSKFPFLRRVS